jgi:hypothetical protein
MPRPIEVVLDKLQGVRTVGGTTMARCPAHDDARASLSIKTGDDERVLLHCHAGCEVDAIVDALGLTKGDLFTRAPRGPRDRVVAEYEYRDEHGELLYVVERRQPKRFVQKRPVPGGGWEYKLNGVRRVPYRLPQLLEGIAAGRWVLIAEGEKDVNLLLDRGFVATCNAGGAGKWHKDWAPLFAGAKVAVLPDNDKTGMKHARTVARWLSEVAEDVRVVTLPDVDEHGDVSDWLALGRSAKDLQELVLTSPAWPADTDDDAAEPDGTRVASASVPVLPDENGASLLDDVVAFIGRYVACSHAALTVMALWVMHTWAVDAFDVSPRLFVSSQEPGSGKSRTLEVCKVLVRAPLFMANVSESYLFRRVDAERCTVLHDEIDTVFGSKARDREELRAMFNAGWERGAVVGRIVGEGKTMRPQDFNVFCPVAMAGLGRLPETIEQRSWGIRLKRRRAGEQVAKFRRREVGSEAEVLRDRLSSWCARRLDELAGARPELPEKLSDRAQDAAEPLLALADAAGGDWPRDARDAVVELYDARSTDQATVGVRLLGDVLRVFDDAQVMKVLDPEKGSGLSSGDLAAALAAIEEAPWSEWGRSAKPITANALARMLRGYDVRPDQHKMAGTNMRGYLRSDFGDAWSRYVPVPPGESVTDAKVLPSAPSAGAGGNTSTPVTVATGPRGVDDLERALAAVPSETPDRGLEIARVRAEDVRRRKALR